jgi:diketogulonate reductase-like aldo/keto reductase
MKTIELNNGTAMPVIGLGTFKSQDPEECEKSVLDAIEIGYRMIDTAQSYGNEEFVGRALAKSPVPRQEIFLTTKVWFGNYENARASVEESMKRLGTDYLDLVLLHWPFGNTYSAYRALEKMLKEGMVRAIGVSNFNPDRLIDLIQYNEIVPAVDQVETNLLCQQLVQHEWMAKYGVVHEGYSPFGRGRSDEVFDDPDLNAISRKYGKTVRQVTLRYQCQSDVVTIPKSTHYDRIKENFDIFDFELTDGEMAKIRALDKQMPLTGTPEKPETVLRSLTW